MLYRRFQDPYMRSCVRAHVRVYVLTRPERGFRLFVHLPNRRVRDRQRAVLVSVRLKDRLLPVGVAQPAEVGDRHGAS